MPRKKEINGDFGSQGENMFHGLGEKRTLLSQFEAKASRLYPTGGSGQPAKIGTLDYIRASGTPFSCTTNGIDVAELIRLSKNAFFNVQAYRNSILTFTALANTKLIVRSKNKNEENFFKNWFKKTQMWDYTNQFILEYLRSGNVFNYKINGSLNLKDVRKLTSARQDTAKNKKIPIRYIILDPESIKAGGAVNFVNAVYSKLLTPYEAERLKDPQTPEEREFFNALSKEERESLKGGTPLIRLKPEDLIAVFNSKMSYEPLGTPPFASALTSINLKLCLRQAELAMAEQIDLAILILRAGSEKNEAKINNALVNNLTYMMSKRGNSRIIIGDYSLSGEFIIPDFNKIINSDKYDSLDKEINASLFDLFSMSSNSNFATSYVTTSIYLEMLNQIRDTFLNMFLIPEMDRIVEEMGFSETPEVFFEDVSLESESEKLKLYVRLYEMGNLTSEGLAEAFKNKTLPTDFDSVEQQKTFKKLKDQELYTPILNQGKDTGEAGRPTGTKAPQSTKKTRPAGASQEVLVWAKVQESVACMSDVFYIVEKEYKKQHGVKRLSKNQKELTDSIATNLMASESRENWESKAAIYVAQPNQPISEKKMEVLELSSRAELPLLGAVIAYHSKYEGGSQAE